jgi:uncharacterized membrane protein YkvA (DUF1232 family)
MANPKRLVSQSKNGLFAEIGLQARLLLLLMTDSRVNPMLKILPMGFLVYLLSPFDFPGPIDDAFIVWLGSTLFIELSPQDVVQEHRAALSSEVNPPADQEPEIDKGDIIDAEYTSKPKE